MRVSRHCGHVMRGRRALTLVELLVVVAIIALLISLLLPSLSKAHKLARTTLCASRLSELGKAMALYSESNDDTPPFIGRGWEDLDTQDDEEWPIGSGITVGQLKRWETWCVNQPAETWFLPQEEWPADVGVEHGSLFRYTRFADLYRCPEFQRISDQNRAQDAFNYTRTILGRKWYIRKHDPEADDFPSEFGAPGPIMKTSEIYSPGKMWMLLDEWYLRHCASPDNLFMMGREPTIPGGWMGNDCMNYYLGDELGRYHGAPAPGLSATGEPMAVLRGHVCHYDNHVELCRDILPGRSVDLSVGWDALQELVDFMVDHLFAQRGFAVESSRVVKSIPPDAN